MQGPGIHGHVCVRHRIARTSFSGAGAAWRTAEKTDRFDWLICFDWKSRDLVFALSQDVFREYFALPNEAGSGAGRDLCGTLTTWRLHQTAWGPWLVILDCLQVTRCGMWHVARISENLWSPENTLLHIASHIASQCSAVLPYSTCDCRQDAPFALMRICW